jgi:hypothetical protein
VKTAKVKKINATFTAVSKAFDASKYKYSNAEAVCLSLSYNFRKES